MKKIIFKSAMIGTLAVFTVASVSAQTKTPAKATMTSAKAMAPAKTKTHAKAIEKTNVPKVVTEEFIREYPIAESNAWYGYPSLRNEMEWYDDYDPFYYTYEYPEYYEVEFIADNTKHHSVYSKEGKKIATHNNITNAGVPKAVTASLDKGTYKGWKEIGEKEEIEKVATKEKVYKITVEKEGKKHRLFYDASGKMLKDEKVIL